MSDENYRCQGKEFWEIAEDARRMLERVAIDNPDGEGQSLSCESLLALLDGVEDSERFLHPLSEALLSLIFERNAVIQLAPVRPPSGNR